MKKIVAVLLTLIFIFALSACNNETSNTNPTNDSSTDNTTQTDNQTKPDNDSSEINQNKLLTGTYKVPEKNIVVDVPNYQEMDKGFTKLYILHGEQYVAITADVNSKASTIQEAHDIAFSFFKEAIQNYSYVNSLSVTKDDTETINGVEVYKYEGTLNCGHDTVYDAYVIGYSFIMDNVPCTITGSVINQSQNSA